MGDAPVHLEVAGYGSKVFGELGEVKIKVGRVELHSCKKDGFLVSMLIVEEDVAVVAEDEIGDGGNDSFAVGAGDEKDGGVGHGGLPVQPIFTFADFCGSALCGEANRYSTSTIG